METFLQNLVKDVKVDTDSEEIRDIQAAVIEYIKKVVVKLEDAKPIFQSTNIVPCGSMSEGTGIWRLNEDDDVACIEFDFLAILKIFPSGSFNVEESCSGFMEIKNRKSKIPIKYNNYNSEGGTPGKMSTKLLSFNLKLQLLRSITSLCNCLQFKTSSRGEQGCEIVRLGNITKTRHYNQDCDRCQIKKETGSLHISTEGSFNNPFALNCSLIFLWKRNIAKNLPSPCELTRQKRDIKQEFVIFIDFLPAIELTSIRPPKSKPSLEPKDNTSDPEHVHDYPCFLVPKSCKREHNTCWKVSHCEFEKGMLQNTSKTHRECYMILKCIQDYMLSDMGNTPGIPTTYVLKTAVLYHIIDCGLETPDLMKCTRKIADFLSTAHKNAFLPHLILKRQNFLAAPSFDNHPALKSEHINWSKNRNYIIGKCWAFIYKLLEQLASILPDGYNFDQIQTYLKVTTTLYGRAYRRTTFRTIVEPEEEELIDIFRNVYSNPDSVTPETVDAIMKIKECEDFVDWEEKLLPQNYQHPLLEDGVLT